MEYPPPVLARFRRIGQGSAAGLPIAVAAGTVVAISLPFAGLITDLAALSHTRIRASIYGSTLTTDAGGQPFILLQTGTIQTASLNVAAPLYSGSSLGVFHNATLSGSLEFDSDDLLAGPVAVSPPTGVTVVLVVKNSDVGAHNVTAATVNVLVEATQYAGTYFSTVT